AGSPRSPPTSCRKGSATWPRTACATRRRRTRSRSSSRTAGRRSRPASHLGGPVREQLLAERQAELLRLTLDPRVGVGRGELRRAGVRVLVRDERVVHALDLPPHLRRLTHHTVEAPP